MKYKFFSEREVHKWFGVSVSTLQKMRAFNQKDPIPFTKIGGVVRYREDLLLKWIDRNTFHSTAEYFEKRNEVEKVS